MPVYALWKLVIRPVLPGLLLVIGVLAAATAVGSMTGWWDMHAILLDALFAALQGALDAIVAAGRGAIDWLFNEIARRAIPW